VLGLGEDPVGEPLALQAPTEKLDQGLDATCLSESLAVSDEANHGALMATGFLGMERYWLECKCMQGYGGIDQQ
jgi:hypothetical protein